MNAEGLYFHIRLLCPALPKWSALPTQMREELAYTLPIMGVREPADITPAVVEICKEWWMRAGHVYAAAEMLEKMKARVSHLWC